MENQYQSPGERAAKLAGAALLEAKAQFGERQAAEFAAKAQQHYEKGNPIRGTLNLALAARCAHVAGEERQGRDQLIVEAVRSNS